MNINASELPPPALTEEQEMLRASARDFLEKECTERFLQDIEASGRRYSPDLWTKIAGLGWLGLVFPPEYGGSGMGLLDLAVLSEELGRAAFPGPYVPAVVLSGLTILRSAGREQKAALLPGLIGGHEIIATILDEPAARPNNMASYGPDSVTIKATRTGDSFVLEGKALFPGDAGLATTLLVPARTAAGARPEEGITLFVLGPSVPGVTINPLPPLVADNACEVILNGVHAAPSSIIGAPETGWDCLRVPMHVAEVMETAQMLGAGEKLIRVVSDDYETRIRSDESLRDPFTVAYIAHLRHDLDGCRAATYEAARRLTAGDADGYGDNVIETWRAYSGQAA